LQAAAAAEVSQLLMSSKSEHFRLLVVGSGDSSSSINTW
jgi:hypothetical protein